jgi:hypothetical protein
MVRPVHHERAILLRCIQKSSLMLEMKLTYGERILLHYLGMVLFVLGWSQRGLPGPTVERLPAWNWIPAVHSAAFLRRNFSKISA